MPVGLGTWHWRRPENPFVFKRDTPPVHLARATTGIVADLETLGAPARPGLFEKAGHGVGNLIPRRVSHGFPGAQRPKLLIEWLGTLRDR